VSRRSKAVDTFLAAQYMLLPGPAKKLLFRVHIENKIGEEGKLFRMPLLQ
jgi:hypothetical protein